MKSFALVLSLSLVFPFAFGQNSELAKQHSLLTTQCKNIRGHAGRVVAEAGQATLNKDVAAAHLDQIARNHTQMELQIASSKKLLDAGQLKSVSAEYMSLEKTCSSIGDLITKLRKEFEKNEPARLTVRKLAEKLRSEMSAGYDVHERLKKKLAIS
jgi:regulator of replication initiation timing